ncbi:hypothetical protein L6452_44314 [Arctium lappa]|uniref:Uncharacterized protein n=1 Tax=Arctium lappa TaxID=4217 RepID=A0ACB8XEX6_ARCLA|nr:hypothetical protein L6452_44314 [Arctium lappa]
MKASTPNLKQNETETEKISHMTPAGQTQRQEQRVVEVPQQQLHPPPSTVAPVANGSNTSGAILVNAANSVSSALNNAREVIHKN